MLFNKKTKNKVIFDEDLLIDNKLLGNYIKSKSNNRVIFGYNEKDLDEIFIGLNKEIIKIKTSNYQETLVEAVQALYTKSNIVVAFVEKNYKESTPNVTQIRKHCFETIIDRIREGVKFKEAPMPVNVEVIVNARNGLTLSYQHIFKEEKDLNINIILMAQNFSDFTRVNDTVWRFIVTNGSDIYLTNEYNADRFSSIYEESLELIANKKSEEIVFPERIKKESKEEVIFNRFFIKNKKLKQKEIKKEDIL